MSFTGSMNLPLFDAYYSMILTVCTLTTNVTEQPILTDRMKDKSCLPKIKEPKFFEKLRDMNALREILSLLDNPSPQKTLFYFRCYFLKFTKTFKKIFFTQSVRNSQDESSITHLIFRGDEATAVAYW